jgi:hypothetical protein
MNCVFCQKELKSPCEQLYGVCKEDAEKAMNILSVAMSFAMRRAA